MATQLTHHKSVLLVENEELFSSPISRWLGQEGYTVELAESYADGLKALDTGHFHLAILDIRLQPNNSEEGLDLLRRIEQRRLRNIMPCIILSAYPNVENLLRAMDGDVARYIRKQTGYRAELINAVNEIFEQKVKINFGLMYDVGTERLPEEIASDINWSDSAKPVTLLLTNQVYDLFGKLFNRAQRLWLTKLNPGLTGAAVIRAQPTWTLGIGPSFVVKVGRRDKVETEHQAYEEYVAPYLPPNATTETKAVYTQHLGALSYRFAASDHGPLVEFDEFYKRNTPDLIVFSIKNLFENTCRYWYDVVDRHVAALPQLYYDAFELSETKLLTRVQIVLPNFDLHQPTFCIPSIDGEFVNPLYWLEQHSDEGTMPLRHCITHGDLTGRNIMISNEGRCWLIDFYRTRKSHVLRDFVILESDVKYRLLSNAAAQEGFFDAERALLRAEPQSTFNINLSAELMKMFETIRSLREIAQAFLRQGRAGLDLDIRREYFFSLLMATLNVVRLRHIPEKRKLQAMVSASLICAELDRLSGREPIMGTFSPQWHTEYTEKRKISQSTLAATAHALTPTAQQRHLVQYLIKGDLLLFLGSAVPSSDVKWPTSVKLMQRLLQNENVAEDDINRLCSHYLSSIGGNRTHLVKELAVYFEEHEIPKFFEEVAQHPWRAVYTTNQHTYLEEVFTAKPQPYQIIISPRQRLDTNPTELAIYKLFGSLGREYRHESSINLPLTEADYEISDTQQRLAQLTGKLIQELNEGKLLLMLHASEAELKMARNWTKSLNDQGLIWVAGSDFSDEDQDRNRELGLRVLPEEPSDLLKAFTQLTQA